MSAPGPEEQVRFLLDVQRLLNEGLFTATYKYALLMSLADLAFEVGDDSGEPLKISLHQLAEKFIEYYWRQAVPYLTRDRAGSGVLLRQNTDRQAAIVRIVASARESRGESLAQFKRDARAWGHLIRRVSRVVEDMPLWKLQVVGDTVLDFLYENRRQDHAITLRPGVAFCLRRFRELIAELVQGAWVRYIRRYNLAELGDAADLVEFLFGSERTDLSPVRALLTDLQRGRCFYCDRAFQGPAEVDHFIPWIMYPVDLGHNFVLSHRKCNSDKSDRLASEEHLESWVQRNEEHRMILAIAFDEIGVMHSLGCSLRIAHWAYARAANSGGLAWLAADEMVPLDRTWLTLLERSAGT